jgi:polysaccharide export outer membrane protein
MLLAGVHSLPAQEPAPARVPAAGDTKPLQYRLGAGDELVVRVFNLEELSGGGVPSATGASEVSYRLDESGQLALPVIGLLAVGGKTLEQVRAEITARCKQYLKDPQVTVEIKVFKSRPVSVFGQVKTPGVFQLEGRKTIVELLSLAGGLTDSAGAVVQVTRRMSEGPIPLANAEVQDNGAYSTARLSLSDLMAGGPAATLTARPYDVITVPT